MIDVKFIIKHRSGASLAEAENAIQCVTRFFWLITGTRQYAENIRLKVSEPEDDRSPYFDAHLLLQEAPISERSNTPQGASYGAPLLKYPDVPGCKFEKCLRKWAEIYKDGRKVACDMMLNQFSNRMHPPYRITLAVSAFEWFAGGGGKGGVRRRIEERLEEITKGFADGSPGQGWLKKMIGEPGKRVIKVAVQLRNRDVHAGGKGERLSFRDRGISSLNSQPR